MPAEQDRFARNRPPTPKRPPTLHAVIGPTAAGKGGLARSLAARLGAELLSVDSMKVYRRMDIGTAKPSPEARAEVPHHLIDLVDPAEEFSAARYLAAAERAEAEVRGRGRLPLHVGGTALYLKVLRHGLFPDPGRDPGFRRELEELADRKGTATLHERLEQVDPDAARRIHPNDGKRLVRALEVHHLTGTPISRLQTQFASEGRPVRWVGIRRARAELNHRIDLRVDRMMASGFLEEVRALGEADAFGATSRDAIGYRELLSHLRGEQTLADAVAEIKLRTRQFARRQATWFRSFMDVHWLEVNEGTDPGATVAAALEILSRTA